MAASFNFLTERRALRQLYGTTQRSIQCSLRRQRQKHHNLLQSRHFAAKPNETPSKPTSRYAVLLTSFRRTRTVLSPYTTRMLAPLLAYGRMQKRSPYLTQLCTTSTIFFLGDLSAQAVGSQRFKTKDYEPIRGLRALIIGAGLSIPGYTWFMWLARNFNYSTWTRTMGTKILIQQFVFTPLVNTYFFSMQILLAGGSFEEAKRRVIDTVPVSWSNSWKVWPAVMAFTFTYVPMQYRSVFNGMVGTCWQTYLSWINQKAEAKEKKVEAVREVDVPRMVQVQQQA